MALQIIRDDQQVRRGDGECRGWSRVHQPVGFISGVPERPDREKVNGLMTQ